MPMDEWTTDEEKEAEDRINSLRAQAERGNLFANWIRNPASVIFIQMLDTKISDSKNAWLSAPDRDKAEIVRLQAQVYVQVKQWIAGQVQAGKVADIGLQQFKDEGEVLSSIQTQERPVTHGQAKENV